MKFFFIRYFALQIILKTNLAFAIGNKFNGKDTLPSNQLISFLERMDVERFYGKPVDSFFAIIPSNYLSMQILPGDQMKRASTLVVRYPSGINLGIYVKDFIHMNPNPPSSSWSIPLFRRENVYRIEIFNGTTCINGCQ